MTQIGNTVTNLLSEDQRRSLREARDTYGESAQILVALEELCELASVCAKYPRYDDKSRAKKELHDRAVDEVADVLIVLDHVVSIFDLSTEEVQTRIGAKIDRLRRWLSKSGSMEQTTVDRFVSADCGSCEFMGDPLNLIPGRICTQCHNHGGAYYKRKEN